MGETNWNVAERDKTDGSCQVLCGATGQIGSGKGEREREGEQRTECEKERDKMWYAGRAIVPRAIANLYSCQCIYSLPC